MSEQLKLCGVSRNADDARELTLHFESVLSDDDVRDVHDMLRESLNGRDPYRGARDDMEIWKRRALEAEADMRRLYEAHCAENSPTHMGEPVIARASQPALAQGDDLRDAVAEVIPKLAALRLIVWGGRSGQPYSAIANAEITLRMALSAQREQPQVTPADGEPDKELWVLRYKSASGVESYLCSNVPAKMQHRYVLAEQPQGVVVPSAIGGGVLLQAARELVEALDQTHWSSWQTTAKFQEPLDELRALLGQREG